MDVYNVKSNEIFAGVPLHSSSRASRASPLAPKNSLPLDLFERLSKETGELNCSITLYSQNLVVFTDEIHEQKTTTTKKNNNKVDNKLT